MSFCQQNVWHTPVPAPKEQEDQELKLSLANIASSRTAWATGNLEVKEHTGASAEPQLSSGLHTQTLRSRVPPKTTFGTTIMN